MQIQLGTVDFSLIIYNCYCKLATVTVDWYVLLWIVHYGKDWYRLVQISDVLLNMQGSTNMTYIALLP